MKKTKSPPPPLPVPPLPDATWDTTAGGKNRDRTALIILAVIALALILLLLLWLAMRFGSQSGDRSNRAENAAAGEVESKSAGESRSESQSAENEKSAEDVANSQQEKSADEPQTAGVPAKAENAAAEADDEALKQASDAQTDSGDLAQDAANSAAAGSAAADSGPRQQATIGALGSEGGAEFFGVSADGNRFVFVIDISSSMANGSFIKARDEAVRSIEQLSPSQDFGVVLYHDSPVTNNAFSMCAATDKHKAAFKQWIFQQSPNGGTEPTAAMKIAIARKPDAIFLLSDGEFDPAAVQLISGVNKNKRVVINTISLSANSSTLQQIADENGGSYRFVP